MVGIKYYLLTYLLDENVWSIEVKGETVLSYRLCVLNTITGT